jgi:Nuclear transport factor 2 (NTF2) domain
MTHDFAVKVVHCVVELLLERVVHCPLSCCCIMSSGTSTPRTASTTPTPPADVSPLTVGTQFVKKYYQVLSTAPEDIDRFYKASTSVVTRGHGSDPAAVLVTDFTDGAAAARFANHDDEDQVIRFEFEHGAIDAQFSVNSGIVLVVTGQVVYLPSKIRKSFVHTFFLGSTVAGVKRSYYVHNDILRFLEMEETNGVKSNVTSTIASAVVGGCETEAVTIATQTDVEAAVESAEVSQGTTDQPVPVEELTSSEGGPPMTKDLAQFEETMAPVTTIPSETNKMSKNDAPGHGVEESKEAFLEDDDMATAEPSSKVSGAPATPGSWASLVARTAPGSTPPATPLRPEKTTTPVHGGGTSVLPSHPPSAAAVKKGPDTSAPVSAGTPAPTPVASADHNNYNHVNNRPQPPFRPRREAECTLIIKNIDDSVTEDEIQALFEPFVVDTAAGYVGCTVQGHRSIAFVDYDTPEPVVKAVQQQTESGPFMIRDLKLDVYQKIFVDKSQPHQRGMGGRGSYRGGGTGGRYSMGGGGREYYNPSSGRGGDGGRAAGRSFRRGGGRDGRAGGRSTQPGDSAGGESGGGGGP